MRSWIFLFLCNLMWALQFTCIKLVQDQVGPLFTVWGPMTLATLMLFPLVRREIKKDKSDEGRRSDVGMFLLLALAGVFPGQMFVTWGTRMSTASDAAIIMLAVPVCTAVFAYLFLGERMNSVRWLSFAIALVGVLLCSQGDLRNMKFGGTVLAGNVLIVTGMLGSAFYNSYGKKALERYSPMQTLFYTYIGMLAVMTPLVLFQERDVFAHVGQFNRSTWSGLILLTVFHNYLSMVLFLRALKELDATQAALGNYLITFFGLPIAAFSLHEKIGAATWFGGILVLASTLIITLWSSGSSTNGPALAPAEKETSR